MKNNHLIFEGCELVGKSYLISKIYDFLEKKYNKNKNILDGCHWINSDIGIFGGEKSKPIINGYIEILKDLKNENVIFEKFHISDIVYQKMYHNKKIDYKKEEKLLSDLNTKIILLTVKPDKKLFEKRLNDRLNLYPHYKRIIKSPNWYIKQQKEYKKEIKKTKLPYIEIDTTNLPTNNWEDILKWLKEK